jgi:hypothetical protein
MKKPIYEKGNYKVTRLCCTSGGCFECRQLGKQQQVVHTDNVSKEWATYVASNWGSYKAKAEPMAQS